MLTEAGSKWNRKSPSASSVSVFLWGPLRAETNRNPAAKVKHGLQNPRLRVPGLGLELRDNRLIMSQLLPNQLKTSPPRLAQAATPGQREAGECGVFPGMETQTKTMLGRLISIPRNLSGGWIITWALSFSTVQ